MAAAPVESDRSPNIGFVDIRFEKTFTVHPRWGRVTGLVDVFNLTNSSTVANYRNYSGSRYKEVIALLDPRIVRFAIRYEF